MPASKPASAPAARAARAGSSSFVALVLAAFVLMSPTRATAVEGWLHPELIRARALLRDARGPETYTAIRRIWHTWDRANPLHVEQTLVQAANDPAIDPLAREYARILTAFARQRRGDTESARRMIRELGFVTHWMLVGPFDNEGKAGFTQQFEPEHALSEPIIPGRAFSGKERLVRWRPVPDAFPSGWVGLGNLLRPESNVCAYLATFVESQTADTEERPVSIWAGIGGAFRLYWNAEVLLEDDAYRSHELDRHAATALLEPGRNRLTLKVCGAEKTPLVSIRIRDVNGHGDARVRFSATALASGEAATGSQQRGPRRPSSGRPIAIRGPLQRFQDLSARTPTAENLQAFAEYLVETGSDDVVRHQARDLATRAAEKTPSKERLLLAARLAEDQNAAHRWLEKAVEFVGANAGDDADLLLARAHLLRQSPRWREALEIYRRVRALAPDRLEAVEGMVALYNEVELHRTALSELRAALSRHPNSVGLLSLYASQLRKLARTVEAAEAEARYAALRFDDTAYLAAQAELAATRHDGALAERWLKRLLDTSPDSLWALGFASRLHRSLGKPRQAAQALHRALELAPEDVGTLRALADLQGELGHRDEQVELLQRLLAIRPQDRAVREYVEHLAPATAKRDETHAWKAERFLADRNAPSHGYNRRTLRDLTVTTVFENGLSSRFRQVVFQPLTDTAAAMARQYSFQYQADREVVQLRGARVYRENGTVDEAIEFGEGAANSPEISMYTSARTFYVQFPRLEPGDVVELRYRVDDIAQRNVFADYFGEVVYLQSGEPVANAEYVLITPEPRQVNVDVQLDGVEREERIEERRRVRRFFAKAVPSVAPEPHMPPWPEVLGFIHVSTYKSWRALGEWYWGLIKDQFELDAETRRLAHQLTNDAVNDLDKVRAIYGWVVENTRYVALEFGVYGYKPRRSVLTIARGWGDCKDKATAIVALLAEVGVESTPVIVRSQMRGGFPSRIPSLEPFDHVIVYVPSLDLYLDGTAEHTGTLELPEMDQGALGLLVNRGESKLVELPIDSKEPSVVRRHASASVRADGAASLEVDYDVRGTPASEWRRRYATEAIRRERLTDTLANEWPGFALEPGPAALSFSGLDDIEAPVTLRARGTSKRFARRDGRFLSMEVTPSIRLTPTFASLSERRLGVRLLGVPRIQETFSLVVPPGMRLSEALQSSEGRSEFGRYALEFTEAQGRITVKAELALEKRTVPAAEYAQFRQFCAAVDDAFSQRLVLED